MRPASRGCAAARRPITLRHLLTHTAGFGYEMLSADLIRFIASHRHAFDQHRQARLAAVCRCCSIPASSWQYGINIDWVGRAVEAASGKPLDEYFRDHIFAPLGMSDSGFALSSAQASGW